MPVETLLISGPPNGGKTALARLVASSVLDRPSHYLRMKSSGDGHTNAVIPNNAVDTDFLGRGWASAHTVCYTADRVFETLPDGLRAVRRLDRCGFVVIEADPDPALRHAYPYDFRVFVMPPPSDIHEVFRNQYESTRALQQVMQDTASFASEIFGLFNAAGFDDNVGVVHQEPDPLVARPDPVERLEISESQVRGFLNSPLGVEIASRIQLQPEFHALIEADVVVVNTGLGPAGDPVKECVKRVERLLSRVRHDVRRSSVLYWGDIVDTGHPAHEKLLKRLKGLFALTG